jgi:predicted negative regulator of RcsB-dependent stress response
MNKKTLLVILILALLGGGYFAWHQYSRKVDSAADLPSTAQLSATELLEAFMVDEAAATTRFVGTTEQVIQVSGTIRSLEPVGKELTNVVLEADNELAAVVCEFANADLPAPWRTGTQVTLKGICTGFLLDVVLVRCVPVE